MVEFRHRFYLGIRISLFAETELHQLHRLSEQLQVERRTRPRENETAELLFRYHHLADNFRVGNLVLLSLVKVNRDINVFLVRGNRNLC